MTDLSGHVALVTGSSRGIGAAVAERFAAAGAAVVVHGRDAERAEHVRGRIADAGGTALVVTADLTILDEIEAMRSVAEAEFGSVDIVVANAGGSPVKPGPLEEMTEQDFRAAVDVNLVATFLTLKSFLPGMKQRGRGNIVTMSSAAARRPDARSPVAYAAAKAGVELLTRDLAAQAGPFGVRVNCLAPETVLTERNLERIPVAMQDQMAAAHPIRRLGTPRDVADAALFLAGPDSGWITGVVLDVAGGAVLA
jgi:3-oxoacyl-[acyl-carrier protein] reductase